MYGKIHLPEWDLPRFFGLWKLLKAGTISKLDRNDFYSLLLVVVKQVINQPRNAAMMTRFNADFDEAASDVILNLVRKMPKMELRSECEKVLVSVLNVMIYRLLIDYTRKLQRVTGKTVHINDDMVKHLSHKAEHAPTEDLNTYLQTKTDFNTCGYRQLRTPYRLICDEIAKGNMPTRSELPKPISRILTPDGLAMLSYRINCSVHDYAEGLSAN